MPIERSQSRDARELDRAATFGRACYQLRGCKDDRNAAFGWGDGVNEVHNTSDVGEFQAWRTFRAAVSAEGRLSD